MDDFGPAVLLVAMLVMCFFGGSHVVQYYTHTSLKNSKWECTEARIEDGTAECIKYERKTK